MVVVDYLINLLVVETLKLFLKRNIFLPLVVSIKERCQE